MSTIPKEIQDKIEAKWRLTKDENLRQAAIFGYQLATDGREELEKENGYQGTQLIVKEAIVEALKKEKEALQSSLKEKDATILVYQQREEEKKVYTTLLNNKLKEKEKECEVWKKHCNHFIQTDSQKYKELDELKAENERLIKKIDFLLECLDNANTNLAKQESQLIALGKGQIENKKPKDQT